MQQIYLNRIEKAFTVSVPQKGNRLRGIFVREKRKVQALENITFSVEAGELVGYIGPNGAGKSTTVKVMSGILNPDGGECRILGRVPWKEREAYVGHIGVVFGQRSQLWWDVPVEDSFQFLRDVYSVPHGKYLDRISQLSKALELEHCGMFRCGSSLWARGCAVKSPPRSFIRRIFSFWTSRPLAWTQCPSSLCAGSSKKKIKKQV